MNPSTLEIHEFSTGIRPERTPDGGWVSRGFTGQYMNRTIDPIPSVVERSIANREFAVTEGASSDRPAIIGRVVGSGENAWSVVAVVTRGRDEKGRSASVYRYFLCEGENNLWKILAWMEEGRGILTFNPFDTKVVGQPNLYMASSQRPANLSPTVQALPLNTSNPILLPPGRQYDVHSINILAIRQANTNRQPVSWAFNVEALEQPRRFQVIQAASDRAYQILQKAIANAPQVLTPVVADEEALKSAIRSLMNSSQVKPEAVQAIAQALRNDQITSKYWHTLFDGQGAKTAISQKIYSPQMVRLVTLRAMVIPETLPEFLGWLNIKGGKNKPDENQTVSLEFQYPLRELFPKEKLTDGIKFLLPKLLKEQITPEAIHWLLMVKGSAWVFCRSQFINDVQTDLELITNHLSSPQKSSNLASESLQCGSETWQRLISYWSSIYQGYSQDYYQPLAELLEQLGDYQRAAYFYQISQGRVPKNVFINTSYLGLKLQREITATERFWGFLQINFVHITIIIPLIVLAVSIGYLGVSLIKGYGNHSNLDLNQQKIQGATKDINFKNTIESLKNITTLLEKESKKKNGKMSRQEVQEIIIGVLCLEETTCSLSPDFIDHYNTDSDKDDTKILEQWVNQIYKYQSSKELQADGVIGKETRKKLEEEVRNRMAIASNDLSPEEDGIRKIKMQETPQSVPTVSPSPVETPAIASPAPKMPDEQKSIANANFDKTRATINQIIKEIQQKKPKIERDQVIIKIKSILQVPNLNYAAAEENPGTERDQLIEAIYNYQETLQSQNFQGSGFMEPNRDTANDLKKQLETKLNIP